MQNMPANQNRAPCTCTHAYTHAYTHARALENARLAPRASGNAGTPKVFKTTLSTFIHGKHFNQSWYLYALLQFWTRASSPLLGQVYKVIYADMHMICQPIIEER